MQGYGLRGNERGTVLIFMLGTLLFLLVFGGFAIDLAFFSTARGELQRSMDAAALAGAGQLGLNDSVFPTVRQRAWDFADLNPTRANLSELNPTGTINLDLNPDNLDLNPLNVPGGNIVLGVWDGATFTKSSDGFQVNAVRCQYATDVPTSFLRILGLNSLRVSAQAIAVAGPPAELEPNSCLAPIGLSSCPFTDGSEGCGTLVSFISSSDDSLTGTNTAAWINLNGNGTPNSNYLSNTWDEMKNGNCPASTPSLDETVGTNNGMIQSVMVDVEDAFIAHFDPLNPVTVTNASDEVVYEDGGWEMSAAVIETECPPGSITGPHPIIGWTRFVMAQVVNGGECAVANHFDGNPWDPLCPPPNGTGTAETIPQNSGSFRAVYGYYSCDLIDSPPIPTPAPRASIATGRKLVQ